MILSDHYGLRKTEENLEYKLHEQGQNVVEPSKKPKFRGSAYSMLMRALLGVCFFYGNLTRGLEGNDHTAVDAHKKHHEDHPEDSELETRIKTQTYNFTPNKMVSYI